MICATAFAEGIDIMDEHYRTDKLTGVYAITAATGTIVAIG
jgi:hypothetical protein